MNKLIFGLGAAGLVLVTGCPDVELADGKPGREEAYWNTEIAKTFPGHRTARLVPPAVKDRYSPKYQPESQPDTAGAPEPQSAAGFDAPPPVDDPGDTVDRAAGAVVVEEVEIVEVEPAAAVKPAPPAAEKPAPAVEPPDPTGSEMYVVKAGDSLGGIARRFYGDSRRKDLIIRANSDLIRDPNRIRPGMKLMIPKL